MELALVIVFLLMLFGILISLAAREGWPFFVALNLSFWTLVIGVIAHFVVKYW